MPLENIEAMKEKALEMGKYYFKGFGYLMDEMLQHLDYYAKYPDRKDKLKMGLENYEKIINSYAKIPFNKLKGKEFEPLFAVRDLLPNFKKQIDKVIKEKNQRDVEILYDKAKEIIKLGYIYRRSFEKLLEDIRNKAKDFKVKMVDYEGVVWYF
ncbi:hypothetical protein KY308_01310 [Candidatus Woesearchaeota archaeon]|nr:hypothetical protein [Candidatus Woesearchaeota archaeon]